MSFFKKNKKKKKTGFMIYNLSNAKGMNIFVEVHNFEFKES